MGEGKPAMTPTQQRLHQLLMDAQQTEHEENHLVTVLRLRELRNSITTWSGSTENALRRVTDAYIEKHMTITQLYPHELEQRACYVCKNAVETMGGRFCMHPETTIRNAYTLCTIARSEKGQCGPHAKLLRTDEP